jgi:DNA end-binding protein Ku
LTKEDFKTAALEKSRTVDIRSFVNPDEIDDRFFESAYYLVPPRAASARMRCCARRSERPGWSASPPSSCATPSICAALEVVGDALVLTLMRYRRGACRRREYHFPPRKTFRKPELQMARTLVENLGRQVGSFAVHRRVSREPDEIIKAKLKGKEAHLVEHVEPRNAEVVDLMERLRQSLAGAGGSAGTKKKTGRARTNRPRAT